MLMTAIDRQTNSNQRLVSHLSKIFHSPFATLSACIHCLWDQDHVHVLDDSDRRNPSGVLVLDQAGIRSQGFR